MDHRWGERIDLRLPVELTVSPGHRIRGWLRDISVSGCRVESETPSLGRHCAEIEVRVLTPAETQGFVALHGCIVRHTPTGFGVEWSELCPPDLNVLIGPQTLAGAAVRGRLSATA